MPGSTVPFKAAGSTLGYKLTSGALAYLPIATLISMEPGGADIEEIDTSVLSSTAMTSIPAIPDNGEVTFKAFYIPDNPAIAEGEALAASPAVIYWQIQLPNGASPTTGTTLSFAGWLKSLKRNTLDIKSSPTCDVTIRVSGGVTIGAAT